MERTELEPKLVELFAEPGRSQLDEAVKLLLGYIDGKGPEAIGLDPRSLAKALSRTGRMPAAWSTTKVARDAATRVLTRNRTGIGKTVVNAAVEPEEAPITLTKEVAEQAAIDVAINAPQPQRTKEQVGSIEGRLLLIHHYRGQPAIQIEERKTKETVWAIVPEEFQHQISESTSVEDVWKGRRVVVRGRIIYGTDGLIARVVATNIRLVETKQVAERELVDKGFTGGMAATEYLDRLREGNLGT